MTTQQTTNYTVRLILGGARSGKSRLAEQYAKDFQTAYEGDVVYIATAENRDGEMNSRIEQHKAQRPEHWQVIESPRHLSQTIIRTIEKQQSYFQAPICILVDCLTLWLSNCLCADSAPHSSANNWQQERTAFLDFIAAFSQQPIVENCPVELILVSNEVGHGIVPMGELSREFVDQSGWLHQAIAEHATEVEFVMAGLPLSLKSAAQAKDNG